MKVVMKGRKEILDEDVMGRLVLVLGRKDGR